MPNVDAIVVIGWRSDAGAYLVDSYPQGVEMDGQDLLNLFSLHRMLANNNLDKAIPNFNFLKIEGFTLVSWYSGFRTTKYLARPDFCVALLISGGGSPNIWEDQLKIVAYNVLSKLESSDFQAYLQKVIDSIRADEKIEPFEGFNSSEPEIPVKSATPPKPLPTVTSSSPKPKKKVDDDFSDLLALAETQANETSGVDSAFKTGADPFASGKDPFASSAADPFAKAGSSDPFASAANTSKASTAATSIPSGKENLSSTPETNLILDELKNIDKKMPSQPAADNKDQLFAYLEKKITLLEAKITVLSKLIRGLQAKEVELNEKNDLIAKLLALLS